LLLIAIFGQARFSQVKLFAPHGKEVLLMSGTYQTRSSSFGIIAHVANIALATVMVFALSAGLAQEARAQSYTETVLYSFLGASDGANSQGVVLDSQGNLYGAAQYGGYMACGVRARFSCGTVFKLDTAGHLTVIHVFTGARGDGINPLAGAILDGQGNLYGTTLAGGNLSCTLPFLGVLFNGCGMVYKLDSSGHETVLHTFTGLSGGGRRGRTIRQRGGGRRRQPVWNYLLRRERK
jgi:uncharacterized repeat protein (TIGR03803 family)